VSDPSPCLQETPRGYAHELDAGGCRHLLRTITHEHLHSGIAFVTPAARHAGDDIAQLERRRRTYQRARRRRPERWTGDARAWERPATVYLNPGSPSSELHVHASAA
jgi:hypothetical protein